jgi:hypothetical protein
MSDQLELFDLLDGNYVAAGLSMPTPGDIQESLKYPLYSSDRFLDPKDIERSLANDRYKTFRRLRSPLIINQGSIGKCTCSSVVGAYHNRRQLDGMANVALADSHLYMNINGGRDAGSGLLNALRYVETKGVSPVLVDVNGQEQRFPLTAFNRRQVEARLLRAADLAAPTFQSFEAYRVPTNDYPTFKIAIASAIARDHQIIVAVQAGRSFSTLRQGYVQQSTGFGNHAVLVHSGKWVGGEDLVHPDIQNSWGPTKNALYGRVGGNGWGEDGFGLITMSSLWQCAKTHVFWVFPGSKVNPGSIT